MIRLVTTLFCFILLYSVTSAQKTPEELGQFAFDCFQNKKLDSFFSIKPTVSELIEHARSLGIAMTSEQYEGFKRRHPLIIENFKEKCNELLLDTIQNEISWTNARIDTINVSSKNLIVDNQDSNSKKINITLVDVYFISNGKRYKLTLGDVASYSGIWKPGNNIEIEKL